MEAVYAATEVVNYPIVEVLKKKKNSERRGAQNPANRGYGVYFNGLGWMCPKEKHASCLTLDLAEACLFDSRKGAKRMMEFIAMFNDSGKAVKSRIVMLDREEN